MKTIRENPFFFSAFAVWLVLGGIWMATHAKGDDIFFWSGHRTAFGDFFFFHVTRLGEGLVFISLILLALFVKFRYSILLATLGLTVMGTSYLSKTFFAQVRPGAFLRQSGDLDRINLVEGVDLHFGPTSFPSGHSMAAFALFAALAFMCPAKRTPGLVFFLLALSVGISRVYLVQHFLPDVYAGSIIGLGLAFLFWQANRRFPMEKPAWYNKGLI